MACTLDSSIGVASSLASLFGWLSPELRGRLRLVFCERHSRLRHLILPTTGDEPLVYQGVVLSLLPKMAFLELWDLPAGDSLATTPKAHLQGEPSTNAVTGAGLLPTPITAVLFSDILAATNCTRVFQAHPLALWSRLSLRTRSSLWPTLLSRCLIGKGFSHLSSRALGLLLCLTLLNTSCEIPRTVAGHGCHLPVSPCPPCGAI